MIRAIVFDMGGVFIDLDKERCVNNFRKLGMGNIEEYLDAYHQRGFFRDLEKGTITEEDFYRQCIALAAPGTTSDDVQKAFLSFVDGIQPYKLDLIKELREKYSLYVLSNNNPIVVRDFNLNCSEFGVTFDNSFKKCYFSYELKLIKPDPEFFRYVIDDIGLPAEELLFVDDSQANIDAARAQGMTCLWYDISTNLRECVLAALK